MKSRTHFNAGKTGNNTQFNARRKKSRTQAAQQDNVLDLTNSTAFKLHKLRRAIDKTPVIDTSRRNNIRNAIINGHYIANPRKIASKIIDMELNLFKKN